MNSNEHEQTASEANFTISGTTYNAQSFGYTISGEVPDPTGRGRPPITSTINLNYGQLIALSGDYVDKFENLIKSYPDDLQNIIADDVYNKSKTWSWKWVVSQPFSLGNFHYLFLASKDPEHFRGSRQIMDDGSYSISPDSNDDSVVAYTQGHQAAINHAINANNDSDQRTAYAINAFYDHFMTDMFSSGHMRVPRRQLHGLMGIGDLYTAHVMHDEDSENGLWVVGVVGEDDKGKKVVWKAYGDGHELCRKKDGSLEKNTAGNIIVNPDNKDNWNYCKDAVKASVKEITDAITSNTAPATTDDYQVLKMKPEVFPPGAEVYPDSKLQDYTITMKRADPTSTKSLACVYWGFDSQKNALLVPKYLVDKVDKGDKEHEKANPLVVVGFHLFMNLVKFTFLNANDPLPSGDAALDKSATVYGAPKKSDPGNPSIVIPAYRKPLYQITTKNNVGGQTPLGTQTFPLYIIAKKKLFVRIEDNTKCNQYITAELDASEGASTVYTYDRDSPPLTVRLPKDRYQGYPTPP